MNRDIHFISYEIQKLLSDFAEQVKEKKYKKVDYKIWRQLTACYVAQITFTTFHKIIFYNPDQNNELIFKKGDKSFGDFLWERNRKTIDGCVCVETPSYGTAYKTSLNNIPSFSTADTVSTIYTTNDISNTYTTNNNNDKNIKENNKMANKMFNFDFGPVSSNQFALSPYGLAISTKENGWVAYDGENLIDVDILNFKLDKMIYKMPATLDSIKTGDVIYHSARPMFVKSINAAEGTLRAVDYSNGSVIDVLPVKSPFGFNFVTKVTSLIDLSVLTGSADAANPFGNMLPFLMLGNDVDPMMFALMSMNGANGLGDMMKNPMMMYLLMQNRGSNDALPFLLMTMAQPKVKD